MPSALHDVLIELFRQRPDLAPTLVRDALSVPLPPWTSVEVSEADLTQAVVEYRADLVLLLRDGIPVFAIALEVQLSTDPQKRYSWPAYAAVLRARWKCPIAVLVVTPDPKVASWAAESIDLGPGCAFRAMVLGPGAIPWVRPDDVVAPQMALLSALAHGNEEGGVDTVVAALTALYSLDDDHARLYYDLLSKRLTEATFLRALESHMDINKYEYESDFARKFYGQGKAEGKAEGIASGLMAVLAARGLELPSTLRDRVLTTTDVAVLSSWLNRAIGAASLSDVFDLE